MATPVFRDYDQKALDAEYNNRVKVKDALEWIARFGAESARARAELPLSFDVPYGAHHAERLDVFPAARPGPAPVHVFIHGGYWHRMDKADFSFVVRGLRPAGAVTVVLNYGLIPSMISTSWYDSAAPRSPGSSATRASGAAIPTASPSPATRPVATWSPCCSPRTGARSAPPATSSRPGARSAGSTTWSRSAAAISTRC
jgi:hypothetical protein